MNNASEFVVGYMSIIYGVATYKKIKFIVLFSLSLSIVSLSVIAGCINTTDLDHHVTNKTPTEITIIDSLNNTLHLSGPPSRIVTLDSYATEILIALGEQNKIVGVGDGTKEDPVLRDYVPDAQIIGTYNNIDFEKIASLKPDIIILPSSVSNAATEKFQKMNLKTAYFDCYYLKTIIPSTREMGKMTRKTDIAERYINFFQKYDAIIEKKVESADINHRPTVYYAVRGDFTTAGNGSGGNMYLEKLKVKNIAREINIAMPKVSPEWIISENPDVIIRVSSNNNDSLSDIYNSMKKQPGFSDLQAIRNNRFFTISTTILYGPREIVGLLYLGKICYPEQFSDVDPELVLDTYSELFIHGANQTQTVYPAIL